MMNDDEPRPRLIPVGTKKVRVDGGRVPEAAPEVKRGRLLELFRAWIDADPRERRRMARHTAVSDRVWLGWWTLGGQFVASSGRLANISRGGALVFLESPPPEGDTVWICQGEHDTEKCIQASVLEVKSASRRLCTMRLEFAEPCPHHFMEAAVCQRTPGRAVCG